MKRLLDGLVVSLGTACLFGLPTSALVLAAWLGDHLMRFAHFSDSALHQGSYQVGAVLMMFVTSAGGLALAMMLAAVLWSLMMAVARQAEALEALPMRMTATRAAAQQDTRGRMARARR